MGIRKYYVLNHGHVYYTGPAAYRRLIELYTDYVRRCKQAVQPVVIKLPPQIGGWRKRIVPLFNAVNQYYGLGKGALQVLSSRRGAKDDHYKGVLFWINENKTRLKSPRKEKS